MAEEVIEDNVFADYGELYDNGKTIEDKVSVINENIQSIKDMISKDWESWLGKDNDTYVASLKNFLITLSNYSTEMGNVGSFMTKISNDYNTAVDTCVGELNDNE
jgi:hypothetical protein